MKKIEMIAQIATHVGVEADEKNWERITYFLDNYDNFGYLEGKKEGAISESLMNAVNEKLGTIHGWKGFCDKRQLRYTDLMNFKAKRLKYITPSIVRICNALEINIKNHS